MPLASIRYYTSNLASLQAEYQLMLIEAAAFPNLKEHEQRSRLLALRTQARGTTEMPARSIKMMPPKGIRVVKTYANER